MELFGGLMIFIWLIGFFLTIIWFILPFVVFAIKGRVEESLIKLALIESRLANIEKAMTSHQSTTPTSGQ